MTDVIKLKGRQKTGCVSYAGGSGEMTEPPTSSPMAALREVLVASSFALFVVDAGGCIIDTNTAGAEILGLAAPDDVIGSSIFAFVSDRDKARARHALRDLSDGVLSGLLRQLEVQRTDGLRQWASVWAHEVRTGGAPLMLIGVSPQSELDLTRLGQPHYHDELATLTTDHDWRVADASPGAEKALGVGAGELVGAPLLGMVHPLDAVAVVAALARLGDGNEALSMGLRLRSGAGWRQVELTASTLCRHTPARLVWVFSFGDRTGPGTGPGDVAPEQAEGELVSVLRAAAERHGVNIDDLSPQHLEIVTRLMQGQSPAEVGEAMFLSPRTVRNHLSEVYRKFGVHTQVALLSAIYGAYGARPTRSEGM